MIDESPQAVSARTHLNCSQCRVEEAIVDAQKALQIWRDCASDNGLWLFSLEKLNELRRIFEEHVARVAGEGVLEDAVTRNPALSPSMHTIEDWQSRLGEKLNQIIYLLSRWQGDAAHVTEIAEELNDFQAEFAKVRSEERHVVDSGLR